MLYAPDKPKRMDFCLWALRQIQLDYRFFEGVIFTDESIFKLNGKINRQTERYWAQKNPKYIGNFELLHDKQIMVWIGVWGDKIIGNLSSLICE